MKKTLAFKQKDTLLAGRNHKDEAEAIAPIQYAEIHPENGRTRHCVWSRSLLGQP